MMYMMYERLKKLRKESGLCQRDLAEYLKCTQVTYSKYELGTKDIPTKTWIALADFYSTSVDYLMGRTDEKNPCLKSKCK